ncbi:MAG: Crp/Fnr family transcriptional regulator [Candidatus Levybacteria bacterium]|nr:Crp/Fnr family transcriptional regulator [Candidatus Levybacteria bacterium]
MRPRNLFEQFFSTSRLFSYKKGDIIIRPDEVPQGVYFLQKGFVRFYNISDEGEELTFLIFKPGDFFPVRFAITDESITYYYEPMTSVDVRRVSTELFRIFLKKNPEVLYEIAGSILLRLRTVFERMQYLAYGNAYEKVASILYVFSKEYGKEEKEGVLITVPMTHKDIASVIGMTRETVSVEMGKLSEKGLISHEGKYVVVKNPEKLRKESLLKSS